VPCPLAGFGSSSPIVGVGRGEDDFPSPRAGGTQEAVSPALLRGRIL